MSSKTLVLHFEGERVAGAVIESSIGSVRIAAVFDDASGRSPEAGPFDRVVASVPADAAYFRVLALPFRDRRRIAQAVGPALEEHLPVSLDDGALAWDLAGPQGPGSPADGATVVAALAPEAALETARSRAGAAGGGGPVQRLVWTASALVLAWKRALGAEASYTAVDVGDGGAVVARVEAGVVTALRVVAPCADELLHRNVVWSVATVGVAASRVVVGGRRAAAVTAKLRKWAGDRVAVEALPATAPVDGLSGRDWRDHVALAGLVLAAGGEGGSPLVDFEAGAAPLLGLAGLPDLRSLQGEVAPLARWAAAAAVLGLLAVGLDYAQLFAERSALVDRAEKLYSAAMPSPSGGVARKLKMEMRLRELSGKPDAAGPTGSPLALLAALSRDVPKNLDVVVDQVEHTPPAARVAGHAASFETVTKMQQHLQKGGAFARVEVKDVHAAVSGEGVEFLLELATAEGGA